MEIKKFWTETKNNVYPRENKTVLLHFANGKEAVGYFKKSKSKPCFIANGQIFDVESVEAWAEYEHYEKPQPKVKRAWFDAKKKKPTPFKTVLCQFGTGAVYACGFWCGDCWNVDRINKNEEPTFWSDI